MKRLVPISLLALTLMAAGAALASPSSATVLCKNATSPCSSVYGAGTVLKAELEVEGAWGVFPIACKESTVELEVTNPGSGTESVSGTVNEFSLGNCNCEALQTVVSKGKFSVGHTSGTIGALQLSEFEVSLTLHGGAGSCAPTLHCLFGTTVTGLTLEGGTTARIKSTEEATIPKISGNSLFCLKNAPVTADYTVVSPEPLYVLAS